MADFPYLPFWTSDYLADTRHLSQAEHGAYMLLIMTCWQTNDCSLPDDDKMLARFAGCDLRTWKRQRETVLEGFFTRRDDGRWIQKRLLKERKHVEHVSKIRSDAAKAKALKTKETTSANGGANGGQLYPYPHPHSESQEESESKPPPSESPTHAAAEDEDEVQHADCAASPVEVQPPDTVSAETMAELIERCPMLSPERVRREVAVWVRSTGSAAETERIILLALRTARDPLGYASRVIGRKSADVVEAIERGRTAAERPEPPPFKSDSQLGSELFLQTLAEMEAKGHG